MDRWAAKESAKEGVGKRKEMGAGIRGDIQECVFRVQYLRVSYFLYSGVGSQAEKVEKGEKIEKSRKSPFIDSNSVH